MNIRNKILTAAVLLLGFTACNDDMLPSANKGTTQEDAFWSQYDFVLADDSDEASTRVGYTTYQHSEFETGDKIGVYVVNASDNTLATNETYHANIPYLVQDITNLSTGVTRQVLIPAQAGHSVTKSANYKYVLYYPYNENLTFNDVQNGIAHAVEIDQNSETITTNSALSAFEHSDLLWSYYTPPSDGSAYEIEFEHALAQIVVEIPEDQVFVQNENTANMGVYLLNMPQQAIGIKFLQRHFEADGTENSSFMYTEAAVPTEATPIHAWNFGYSSTGDRQFRAMVPAHTITMDAEGKSSPIIRVFTANDASSYTEYRINRGVNNDLKLQPGYTYRFCLSRGEITTETEITDDDSWVLDVLDPETGEPVGLLCREYLHYQPQQDSFDDPDQVTGTKVKDATSNQDKTAINSQAWVFYNLQSDGKTPELSRGVVLRFIYDIHINSNNYTTGAAHFWPLPHTQPGGENVVVRQGMFTPEHGYTWIQSPTTTQDGGYYGISSMENGATPTEHFMHGGTIVWDGDNDKISEFTEPTEQITNASAINNGHIAIGADGSVAVSYSAISESDANKDIDGKKVGLIIPRNLIDKRINAEGLIETTPYPIVKIGYNQFWMSKPLRATTLTDGTPITCYNKKGDTENPKPAELSVDVNTSFPPLLPPGYMFGFRKNVTNENGETVNYDPYNDPTEMAGGNNWDNRESKFRPAPRYNKPAVENDLFVAQAPSSEYEYIMPTANELTEMMNYFGYSFGAKLCTREISRLTPDGRAYSDYTGLMRGETLYEDNSGNQFFTANISGFNLYAMGYYSHMTTDGNNLGLCNELCG